MFHEEQRTSYDLNWTMFRIPVRVHPSFWLIAALMGWGGIREGLHYVLIWIGCVFVSILLHELGHVIVGRWFGCFGAILLYGFGGLAFRDRNPQARWKRIAISAAGPGVQLLLYAVLSVGMTLYVRARARLGVDFETGRVLDLGLPKEIWYCWNVLLLINLYWPILNLLPVWPLDGGHICRELCQAWDPREGTRLSLHISCAAGIAIALHCLAKSSLPGYPLAFLPGGGMYTVILFGMLAYQSFQILQSYRD